MTIFTSNIRVGSRPFSDPNRFPYGFKKSGDFTISEASILSIYGDTLFNLEIGSLLPSTPEEEHFIQCAKGQADIETSIERAWMKYAKLARSKRHFYTMHSSRARENTDIEADSDYDFDDSGVEV